MDDISIEVENIRKEMSYEGLSNVMGAVRDAVTKTKRYVPLRDMYLLVAPHRNFCSAEMPAYAAISSPSFACISVDPASPCYNNDEGLQFLSSTVARTLYQMQRAKLMGAEKCVMDVVVSDGLSHAFARNVLRYPHARCYVALQSDDEMDFVQSKVREHGHIDAWRGDFSFSHALLFRGGRALYPFGGGRIVEAEKYPKFGGHSFGYALAKAWLKRTGKTAVDAIGIPTDSVSKSWLDGELAVKRVVSDNVIRQPVRYEPSTVKIVAPRHSLCAPAS